MDESEEKDDYYTDDGSESYARYMLGLPYDIPEPQGDKMVHNSFPEDALDKELVTANSRVFQYDGRTETWSHIVKDNGTLEIVGDAVYIWLDGLLVEHSLSDPKMALTTVLKSIDSVVRDWTSTKHPLTLAEASMLNTAHTIKRRLGL